MEPLIIGLAGGTASGKTTACNAIKEQLPHKKILVLSMDRFYSSLPPHVDATSHNFDIPSAYDFPLFRHTLHQLSLGQPTQLPLYCYESHQRLNAWESTSGDSDVIIVEGILVLHDEQIRQHMDLKIYIDIEEETRLARRIQRDLTERGRTLQSVIDQYVKTVKSAHDTYVQTTMSHADLIFRNNALKASLLSNTIIAYLNSPTSQNINTNKI
jgi:uridine kinase